MKKAKSRLASPSRYSPSILGRIQDLRANFGASIRLASGYCAVGKAYERWGVRRASWEDIKRSNGNSPVIWTKTENLRAAFAKNPVPRIRKAGEAAGKMRGRGSASGRWQTSSRQVLNQFHKGFAAARRKRSKFNLHAGIARFNPANLAVRFENVLRADAHVDGPSHRQVRPANEQPSGAYIRFWAFDENGVPANLKLHGLIQRRAREWILACAFHIRSAPLSVAPANNFVRRAIRAGAPSHALTASVYPAMQSVKLIVLIYSIDNCYHGPVGRTGTNRPISIGGGLWKLMR
jgi:hypothetical protein